MLKSGLALATPGRPVATSRRPQTPSKPDGDFATRRGLALARSDADVRGPHILIGQLLHVLTCLKVPRSIARLRDTIDEVTRVDGITERIRRR